VSVTNVVGSPRCGIANTQLVHLDGVTDPSVQTVTQSPTAQFCSPSAGFQPTRYYTTPYAASTTVGVMANTLYAVPLQIPCGMTPTKVAIDVTTAATGQCELGIYGSDADGQPANLIVDAGHVGVNSVGVMSKPLTLPLPPGLVFLVVGCSQAPTLQAGTGGASNGVLGLTSPADANALITASWTYAANALPTTFPMVAYATTATPLVYLVP
jgi:hypothetical protein